MMIILCIELIGYIGIIWLQATWYKRGELNANRFALFQIAYWSLFTITAFLAISTTFEVAMLGIVLSVLWWIMGYPIALWIYKQVFPH